MRAMLLATSLSLTAASAAGACAPASLTRIVTRDVTPSLAADHFARKPKTIYRLGDRLARMEEQPDAAGRKHLLTVVSAPNVWAVNLADRTGKHMVDPGPTYDVHAPLFMGRSVPRQMSQLEFGCEAEFVRAHMAPEGEATRGGKALKVHRMVENTFRLEVLTDAAGKPAEARLFQDEKPVMVIAYDAYETGLRQDPALFARPEGIAFASSPGG